MLAVLSLPAESFLLFSFFQTEEADSFGVFAAGASNDLPKSTPGLLSQERIGKVTQDFKDVFEPI